MEPDASTCSDPSDDASILSLLMVSYGILCTRDAPFAGAVVVALSAAICRLRFLLAGHSTLAL